mgnify:CR=1 FL=1
MKNTKKVTKKAKSTVINLLPAEAIVTIVFTVLRVAGVIDWAWYWIISPFWFPAAAIIGFVVGAFLIVTIVAGLLIAGGAAIEWFDDQYRRYQMQKALEKRRS